ncbi:unnamed protein product [Mytilus edulis]|uniref:Retrovirus-related Pol polyprotein from transposon n=1 Tax=Mytilus edulis TaxID=6550 RepID=A0A8S3QUF8_MYTED|nr:unnamed protein product [Mytilus edulis]
MDNIIERLVQDRKTGNQEKPAGPCYFCGAKGHIKRECRKFQASVGRQQNNNVNQKANTRTYTQGTQTANLTGVPGRQHNNADGLSRRPCSPCTYCTRQESKNRENTEKDDIEHVRVAKGATKEPEIFDTEEVDIEDNTDSFEWVQSRSLVEIATAQQNDTILKQLWEMKVKGTERPNWEDISFQSITLKVYWAQWNKIKLENGVLYRCWQSKDKGEITQLILPDCWHEEVMKMLHDDPPAGHFGQHRTLARVSRRFYWAGYKDYVIQWCRQCKTCEARKKPQKHYQGLMKQYLVGAPLERVAIDILGPLPKTHSGYRYILVLTDYFTRWAEAYPMIGLTAEEVAEIFVSQFVSRFGVPKQLHTDRGTQFESKLFQDLCSRLKIDKTRTTAMHPQSDGMVERLNRTLEDILSKYVTKHQKDWDEHLQLALMAYRSSDHESTGFSPSMLMFGRGN